MIWIEFRRISRCSLWTQLTHWQRRRQLMSRLSLVHLKSRRSRESQAAQIVQTNLNDLQLRRIRGSRVGASALIETQARPDHVIVWVMCRWVEEIVPDGQWQEAKVIQSQERAPYSLTLVSRRSIHAIFRSEASLARTSRRPETRNTPVKITAKSAPSVTIGRSKSRSTSVKSTITSSNRNKLSSLPSSNKSRNNSKSEQLPIRPQTSL